jgi:hypothetical protein
VGFFVGRKGKIMRGQCEICKGKILGIIVNSGCGLASLVIKDSLTSAIAYVTCESAPTVRCLKEAFGKNGRMNVIDCGGHLDQEIYYSIDDHSILDGFTPARGASKSLRKAYEIANRKH